MAPSIVPPIELILDKPRHLRLDNAAMLLAERELSRVWQKKVSLLTLLADADGLGLNDISVLLWTALLHEDPSLTLLRVQDMMDMTKLVPILEAVYAAWNAATVPVQPAEETPQAPLAMTSTGVSSGAMPEPTLG